MSLFKGSCTALVTLLAENGKICFEKMGDLIEFQIKNKTDAILACGTTGEASTLSLNEHMEILNFCKEKIDKRIPFIAGCGSNSTSHAVMLSKEAEKTGADALLVVTPYYNKCSQKGAYLHYKTIAEQVKTPVIIYNVPGRTGFDLDVETIAALSKIKNIAGIKEASGKIEKALEIKRRCPEDFSLYCGNDDMTVPVMEAGGEGVISVLSNILPFEVASMTHKILRGEDGREDYRKMEKLAGLLFKDVNPIPVKACLYLMGMADLNYRLPLCEPDDALMTELKNELSERGLIK